MTLPLHSNRDRLRTAVGLLGGLGATSMALSAGFIWAYRASQRPDVWSSPLVPRVFLAAFVAWWGYLIAHRAVTGEFIDTDDAEPATETGPDPGATPRIRTAIDSAVPRRRTERACLVVGATVLVAGMVIGTAAIRAEDLLATNVGGVLFLGGYVVAHYGATRRLL